MYAQAIRMRLWVQIRYAKKVNLKILGLINKKIVLPIILHGITSAVE